MVVTKHPLAPAVGAEMLAAGGNAVDAAVAALFTLTAVEPAMFGILCGGFANPHRLQLKATSLSWPQSPQRRRRKPWARMPHSRKASNSSLTNCGRSALVAACASAMKVAACCCTRRYSVVCSGRWRS
jgi:gamma-glutamyltranspeptidase